MVSTISDTGSLTKRKSFGRPRVSEATVDAGRQCFVYSPQQSTTFVYGVRSHLISLLNVFCAVSNTKVYGAFLSREKTVDGI